MQHLGDMPPGELRRHGHAAVDWVVDYLTHVGQRPVLAQVPPGAIRAGQPTGPPRAGEPMEAILADLERVVMPGMTHWNHPRFFAYFAVTGSGPGILGELISAALNVNGMLWRTAPAATELEQVSLDWLRQLLGLPTGWHGVIMDTASMATLCALAAARERAMPEVRREGLAAAGRRPRVYASAQAHSSVEKAAITLGFGRDGFRAVPTDAAFRLDPVALARAVDDDRAQGFLPLAVVATVGTTSTTSVDPVPAVAAVCAERGLWLHVDAAYGGMAGIVPELRHVLDGVDHADSLVCNPHKWLFTPIDCSAFYVRDLDVLKRAFSLVPEYLRTSEEDVENYMDWGVQLGRRFRALKLWMVIRYFGAEGLQARIREHVRLGQLVADWADQHEWFERVAPAPLSTVCFRARCDGDDPDDADASNEALLAAVNATGRAYLSHTVLDGRYTLRLAIGNIRTEERHVRLAWKLLQARARR